MAKGKHGEIDQDTVTQIRISKQALADGKALAIKKGVNFSQLVRDLLAEAIAKEEGKSEDENKINNIKNFLNKISK